MDGLRVELDEETGKFLTLYLFANVSNTDEIRKMVISGELKCCVLKAGFIVDPFQVIVAANKAVVSEKYGKLTTRTLYSEILFNLSLSKNITNSLTKFGIDDKEENILLAVIHDAENADIAVKYPLAIVKGERVTMSRLNRFCDVNAVKKIYKIEEAELKISTLIDCVVSKINTKDFASY